MSAIFLQMQDGTSLIEAAFDLKESIILKVSLASVFKKTKEFLIRFTLAVGSSGEFGIFAFRTCATLEKWFLNVEAFFLLNP